MSSRRPVAPSAPRVLHVTSSLDGGGAERVLLTVLRGLPNMPQHLALEESGALRPLVPLAVTVHRARTEIEMARLLARLKPDLVHTWLDDRLLATVVPAAHLGIPLVHRLYNVPSVLKVHEPRGPGHKEMMARALDTAARVVALSETAADDAVEFYGIERPLVIHNGFPLARQRAHASSAVRKPKGRFVILNVARLAAQKGQACLIDAVARISNRHADVELWIAGIGPLEEPLRRQAAEAGISSRVKFLGFQEDMTNVHASADLFVFPSIFEGFGNALGEALTAGLPIVASDLSVIRNDVLGGEPAAVLFPAGDAAALAQILDRLVSDVPARADLRVRARAAGRRFGVDRMLEGYRAVYESLAGESHAAA